MLYDNANDKGNHVMIHSDYSNVSLVVLDCNWKMENVLISMSVSEVSFNDCETPSFPL